MEVAHEQVGMSSSRNKEVLEYNCNLVALYHGTERCIGESAYTTEISLESTEVKFDVEIETHEYGKLRRSHSVDDLGNEGRVEAGRRCRSSKTNRYNDGKSMVCGYCC